MQIIQLNGFLRAKYNKINNQKLNEEIAIPMHFQRALISIKINVISKTKRNLPYI